MRCRVGRNAQTAQSVPVPECDAITLSQMALRGMQQM